MTHKAWLRRLFEAAPGEWFSTAEILRLEPMMVHSRVSDLRADGLVIEHRTTGRGAAGSEYRLVSYRPLEAGACADPSRGAGAPASSGSNLGLSSGSPDTPRPEDGSLVLEGQETPL